MNLSDVKNLARTLFLEGVRAADPEAAVKRELSEKPLNAAPNGRLFIVAYGKAACAMMDQALKHTPKGQRVKAIAITNYENARDIQGCQVFASGHPLPDENGIKAGKEVMRLLETADKNDEVLCLISGGGSALLPTPRAGITLGDKVAINEALLSEGFDISQMNAVRQQLSVLKGGGLLDLAHPAPVRSLIISDVVGDDIRVIASGPIAPALDRCAKTTAFLKSPRVQSKLQSAGRKILTSPRIVRPLIADNAIICSNQHSLRAIANAAADWAPQIVPDPLTGDVKAAAQQIVDLARTTHFGNRKLLIWGGETTVTLRGRGRGGRNQELAIHVANLAKELPGNWVFLSGGTDGRDGPTDAAGGIVTAGTIARAQADNLNVVTALKDNDSYRILESAGDLLKTDATGTNVADVQLMFLFAI